MKSLETMEYLINESARIKALIKAKEQTKDSK